MTQAQAQAQASLRCLPLERTRPCQLSRAAGVCKWPASRRSAFCMQMVHIPAGEPWRCQVPHPVTSRGICCCLQVMDTHMEAESAEGGGDGQAAKGPLLEALLSRWGGGGSGWVAGWSSGPLLLRPPQLLLLRCHAAPGPATATQSPLRWQQSLAARPLSPGDREMTHPHVVATYEFASRVEEVSCVGWVCVWVGGVGGGGGWAGREAGEEQELMLL